MEGAMETTTKYDVTIYDGNPANSGDCAWPDELSIEAADADDALRKALSRAVQSVRGLSDYPAGTRVWATVRDSDGDHVAQGSTTV
jgi:hypothetical protein